MERSTLAELIKEYVYIGQSLAIDPDNTDHLLAAAKLYLEVGLLRSAVRTAEKLLELKEDREARSVASDAQRILKAGSGRSLAVSCDRTGFLLIADQIANRLFKCSHAGEIIWSFEREGFEDNVLYHPDLLAADRLSGDVYVGSSRIARIQVFDSAGVFLRAFAVPKRFGSRVLMKSIACDESGSLWVADSLSGSIRRLDCEGNELSMLQTGWK